MHKISQHWSELDAARTALLQRAEQYAEWTLPYLFPAANATVENAELPTAFGSIGARCVNHLANVITETLFPAGRAFFRVEAGSGIKTTAAAHNIGEATVEASMSALERASMATANPAALKSAHTEVSKLLIVTGNALVFYTKNPRTKQREALVYSMRDYVCVRDPLGTVLTIITRDAVVYGALPKDVQAQYRATNKDAKDTDKLRLYTRLTYDRDSDMYTAEQALEDVNLVTEVVAKYSGTACPWRVLTWHRSRGDNYGRGLVEDYAYTFSAYNAISLSYVTSQATRGDVKRCVDPSSTVDVETLNKSKPFEWIAAKKDELWTMEFGHLSDDASVAQYIIRQEQLLSQAFMLTTAAVRDAERVTAEEIRLMANELEKSHGGIYSKLAAEWQLGLAYILMDDAGIPASGNFRPKVITGMEAMSRNAEVENLYNVFRDLSILGVLPPQLQRRVNEAEFVNFVCASRNVSPNTLFLPDEVVQAQDAQRAQAAKELADQKAMSDIAMGATQA